MAVTRKTYNYPCPECEFDNVVQSFVQSTEYGHGELVAIESATHCFGCGAGMDEDDIMEHVTDILSYEEGSSVYEMWEDIEWERSS